MSGYPKITIVTPVFNGAKYIERTIKSVINQNYPNLEYMIFDGGSTDGTIEIIKKYENKLAYWTSEKDGGMYFAIQKGFDRSTGEIMAWVNSDDYYSENCFQIISELFGQFNQVDWLTGLNVSYDEKSRIINAWSARNFTRLDLLCGDYKWIQQESTFWRRSLWEKAGAKLGPYKYADDFELWLRFSRFAELYCTDAYLGGFRQRSEGQISLERLDMYIEECSKALELEPKTTADIKQMRLIKNLGFLSKALKKTKILNPALVKRIKNKLIKINSRRIRFDRMTQKFYL